MKTDIHPTYFADAQIECACGSVVKAGSTVENIRVELCSNCHPFYTGKQNLVDTAGRVDRFAKIKAASSATARGSKKAKAEKRQAQKEAKKKANKPTILNEA